MICSDLPCLASETGIQKRKQKFQTHPKLISWLARSPIPSQSGLIATSRCPATSLGRVAPLLRWGIWSCVKFLSLFLLLFLCGSSAELMRWGIAIIVFCCCCVLWPLCSRWEIWMCLELLSLLLLPLMMLRMQMTFFWNLLIFIWDPTNLYLLRCP